MDSSKKTSFLVFTFILFSCVNLKAQTPKNHKTTPNIIFIYMDDLGYGDVSANGSTTINTPNIDKLANGGIRFTKGYASSATCTPSRYALLTGEYPWKNKKAKILPGTAPLIIDEKKITIPKLLKDKGYYTGIVGKWHLGLGNGVVNWNQHISPSPNEVGFDYSYIMAATQDRVPTVYIKNGNVVNLETNDPIEISYTTNFYHQPTAISHPELLTMKPSNGHSNTIINGIPRIGYMKGGKKARWNDIDMADHFLQKAQHFVKQNKNKPFFLYYALQQPHVPRTPNPRFVGKSGMGPRGDAILEGDWCIGQFIKTLETEGLLENTFIVFSSDNGPVLDDGYADNAYEKLGIHKPWGEFRGGKYSLFEAGTRVPFFTYWKGVIHPKVSNALVCQMDLLSSISKLVGSHIKTKDSQELLNTFLGKENKGRNDLIIEATSRTAYKKGDWVMIPPYTDISYLKVETIETGSSNEYKLYNLKKDKGQNINLAKQEPKILSDMINGYQKAIGDYNLEVNKIDLK
ncbi:sulfatase-like hydrolase/transferase [Wenyingzhuangia sp. IMCC45467]